MRRNPWALLPALLLLGAPAASAQQSSNVFIYGGGSAVSVTQVPAHIAGRLTVSFRSDAATGCAAEGLCAYGGTVSVSPASNGYVLLARVRSRGHLVYQVQLNLLTGLGGGATEATVTRDTGHYCADARPPNAALDGTINQGNVAIPLFQTGGGLLSTSCAGPLDGDLAGTGPRVALPLTQLLRGRRTVDLSGTWPFASQGFAGTIDSSLQMSLGAPSTQRLRHSSGLPRGIKTRRERQLIENVTVTQASGSLSLSVSGDPTDCEFLDACGIQGTLSGVLTPAEASGNLFVLGPASRPYGDFLAGLGLGRHGNPRGLLVGGTLSWMSGGSLSAALTQGTSCNSSGPLGGGLILFGRRGGQLTARYELPGLPRTRCPSPLLTGDQTLASGSVSLGELKHGTFTLRLSGTGPLSADGYLVNQRNSLTLTVRRGRPRPHTFLAPTG